MSATTDHEPTTTKVIDADDTTQADGDGAPAGADDTTPADGACAGADEAADTDERSASTAKRDAAPKRLVRRRCGRVAPVVGVFVGALAAAGVMGWKLWSQHSVAEAGKAAQQAAISYTQVLTSIDSNQLDQNFTAVLDGATGEFKDTYTKSSAQLRQLLIDNKATAHGTVIESAIQSQTPNKVVVLLMVDQTVTNAARPDNRVDRSRMKITMEKVGNRWLASKVELP